MVDHADIPLIKRQLKWGAAALLLMFALWSSWWFVAADQAVMGAKAWVAEQNKAGFKIKWQEIETSGYPFHLQIKLANPVIEWQGSWRWSTPSLILDATLWNWSDITITGDHKHRIFLARGSQLHNFDISVDTLSVGITLDAALDKALVENINAYITVFNLSEDQHLIAGFDSAQIKIDVPEFLGARADDIVGALDVKLHGLEIPELSETPLGSELQRLALRAELLGGPPTDLKPGSLTKWRDQGGVIEIRYLTLGYGAVELEASGTMALDRELQPVGSMVAKVQGYSNAINAMQRARMISSAEALGAKIVLGTLARKDPANGRSILDIAISLQQQTLHAGPIALTKLPTVHW